MTSTIFERFSHKKEIILKNILVAFRMKIYLRRVKKKIIMPKGDSVETRALFDSFLSIKAKTRIIRKKIRAI